MIARIIALLLLSGGIAIDGAGLAATAPRLAERSIDALPRPLPLPYDERADARTAVSRATRLAKAEGKLLLIDMGGNWCPDCRVLAGVMALPAVDAFLKRHYRVVMVDVGRRDRNLDIAARHGVTVAGVPSLLVIDPRRDRLLNAGRVAALADARSLTPQALADWLARWVD